MLNSLIMWTHLTLLTRSGPRYCVVRWICAIMTYINIHSRKANKHWSLPVGMEASLWQTLLVIKWWNYGRVLLSLTDSAYISKLTIVYAMQKGSVVEGESVWKDAAILTILGSRVQWQGKVSVWATLILLDIVILIGSYFDSVLEIHKSMLSRLLEFLWKSPLLFW